MLHSAVEKARSPVQGWGLVARQLIREGERVCWPAPGEQETFLGGRELRDLAEERQHLAYRRVDGYVLRADGSQYLNHSCDPNAWWLDDDVMVARRDIRPGEELTYDYSTSEVHPWWRPKWRCQCGSASCRGAISGRDVLDPDFYERYRGHLPSWVERFRQEHHGLRGRVWTAIARIAEIVRQKRTDTPDS